MLIWTIFLTFYILTAIIIVSYIPCKGNYVQKFAFFINKNEFENAIFLRNENSTSSNSNTRAVKCK